MNPVYRFFATTNSFAPLILRLLLALIAGVHVGQRAFGWMDGPGWKATLALLTSPGGLHLPYVVAALGLLTGTAAALALFCGFCTRLAAGIILCGVAVAIYAARWDQGFLLSADFQYPFTLGGIAVALMFAGGGPFSLDRAITRQLLPPDTGFIG
jgi:putative oxidoreductase